MERSEHTYTFLFASTRLNVDALWRITDAANVILTREDDGQSYGLPAAIDARARADALLKAKILHVVVLDQQKGDLTLDFGSLRLEVVNDSSGYEPWTLHTPTMGVIAASGGKVQTFEREV